MRSVTVMLVLSMVGWAACGPDDGDDNNNLNNNNNAVAPYCGDGVVDDNEACDEGAGNSDTLPDTCREDCTDPVCGDAVQDTNEECDDGDTDAGDGCNANCVVETGWECFGTTCQTICGDTLIVATEECDTTNLDLATCMTETGLIEGNVTCTDQCVFDTTQCHDCGNGTAEGPEVCDDGNSENWDGCDDTCAIREFQINAHAALDQTDPHVTILSGGEILVSYTSAGQDTADLGVFARRFSSLGVPLATEDQINTTVAGDQQHARVAPTAAGGYAVTWMSELIDGSGDGVAVRFFDNAGTALSGEVDVNTATVDDQWYPEVGAATDGRLVIAFARDYSTFEDIGAQRFDAARAPAGTEIDVSGSAAMHTAPFIGVAPDGRFVVTWRSDDADGSGVWARRYDALGAVQGAAFAVNTTTAGNQYPTAIALGADGSFIVVWTSDGQDSSGLGVYAQRFAANEALVGAELHLSETTDSNQDLGSVALNPDGSFMAVYASQSVDGDGLAILARPFDASAAPVTGESQINVFTAGDQTAPRLARASDGTFVVVWQSEDQDGSGWGIFGQRLAADGSLLGVGP